MANEMNAKQMRQLLQSISTDPQLKQSKDSILLAEDQYPESLDAIFTRLTIPTTLQNTINLLKWSRKSGGTAYDAELKAITIKSQDYIRTTYQLTPTADSPWDTYTFRQWKYFVTNLCLSAVQDALKSGDNAKGMQHLFAPDRSDQAKGAVHNTRNNVQGMLLYHPLLLNSPWQAPDDLDQQIQELLKVNEPAIVARSERTDGHTSYDKDNAIKALDVLTTSIKQSLSRIYTMSSQAFHVLLRELIPRARADQSNLFTHLKGARTDHIINLRAHHAKTRAATLPQLTREELKPHSAEHTLRFLQSEYVEVDDDAPHYTWSNILTATRQPRMSLFAWVDSFTLLALRYGETVKRISNTRQVKINRTVSKQITDDEKLIISTISPAYSSVVLNTGKYVFADLVKLLAQNATSFTKKYVTAEHSRIGLYLQTRALKYKRIVDSITQGTQSKGKGKPIKKQRMLSSGQRAWVYVTESVSPGLSAPSPFSKGKGKYDGKGKSKMGSKGKGKGKSIPSSKGKGKGKGKFKGNKGKRPTKGKTATLGLSPGLPSFHTQNSAQTSASDIKCHFCHAPGHIKPNCRKWLALSQSERYQQRNSHETKYQLIYDHLEDSVLAPRPCQYCSNDECDGQNCESPFDQDDYSEASLFFTQSLSQLVVNAKLDRPLDSHAPQTEYMYHCDDDWGEQHENEYQDQWDTEEGGEQTYDMDTHESYPTEAEYEGESYEATGQESSQDQDDYLDEDDQDNYE
jgi:hypothetical protein